MKFYSEKKRMLDPQAKLIPTTIWNERFYDKLKGCHELTDCQRELMVIPQDDLLTRLLTLMTSSDNAKLTALLCCAYRQPLVMDADLYGMSNAIKLSPHQKLLVAATTGRIIFLNRSLGTGEEDLRRIIGVNSFEAFREAAANGHLDVVNKLIELVSSRVPGRIEGISFAAVRWVTRQLSLNEPAPSQVQEMIAANSFDAFHMAASNGHLDVLNKLIVLGPSRVIVSESYSAFCKAASSGHLDVLNKLLTLPDVLAPAEIHGCEYGKYVQPFIANKLKTLKRRQEAGHPSIVVTQQEATSCLIMLRSLMRETPSTPESLANIDFLMAIPVVKSRLHFPITSNESNELLRSAIRLNNRKVMDRLLSIPEVMAQAERDYFYPEESLGQMDLRALAQNCESSMLALSPQEQAMLKRLEKKYKPLMDNLGLEVAFHRVYQAMIDRYNANPASFVRESGETIPLPLQKESYDEMARKQYFSEADKKNSLEAYYRHPTHTVFRYLSKPNPWMASNSSYVEVNQSTGERWSTFENYKELISLLWMAASDESEPGTDGFTLGTRVDEWLNELSLIARAHNWDGTRVKTDKEGQQVLNSKNKEIREEFDDLTGDKPSCYSGVKRRLFQSLKGHPLYLQDICPVIAAVFREKLREHMRAQFERAPTGSLEAVYVEYL